MPDVYTDGTQWSNFLVSAYDRYLEQQLRSEPIFRQMVDKRPVDVTNPGPTITLTIAKEFAALATTPLTDSVDISAVAPPNPNRVTVTLNEYGNADVHTQRLTDLSFTPQVDPEIAHLLGLNMVDTVDKLVQNTIDGATHIIGVNATAIKTDANGFAEGSVAAGDNMSSAVVRDAQALLRRRNAHTKMGDNYVAIIHPDVAVDILSDTGWLSPHQYVDTTNIYNAEIGTYLGSRFVQSPRCTVVADGATGTSVYRTYFLGAQAIVEASVRDPQVVLGPQTDKLRRFTTWGWKCHMGWAIFRQEAIQLAKTASSIAAL